MATHDVDGGPDRPAAARCWRVVASELRSPGMWDVELLDLIVDGASIARHLESGHAGPGYEPDRAFRDDGGWWGGRAASEGADVASLHLGVEFDRAVVPTAITLTHAPGVHRAGAVEVQSSDDGIEWHTVAEADLGPGREAERSETVFYAPPDLPSSSAWRLVAGSTANGFAWDVHRIRVLRMGADVAGRWESSGDAGVGFGVANATDDRPEWWGGRADGDGRLHLTLSGGDRRVEVDRIVLDQGAEHWAGSVILERLDAEGEWQVWRHLGGLRPGRNDLLLARQPRRATTRVSVAPAEIVRFGPFDDRRILVLVAAYRDPELAETVAHAFAQAAFPEHVRFAICHQHDDDTRSQLDPWADDPRVRVDAVEHTESLGCCWARNRTFAMYDDEPYILQIDAHMRFAARWDVRYVEMLESLDVDLPILSSYPPRYVIGDDGTVDYDTTSGAQRLYVDEVHDDLTTRQKTTPLRDLRQPEPSPVLAAGQLFTRGSFCRDVDYDPDIYFGGEEISLAARAFTHGYDLFAPNQNLVWHLYQHDHPKHWDDHDDHTERHHAAADRLHTLFRGDHRSLGRYGLGSKRTLVEFEDHAGIRLGARRVAEDGSVTITVDRSAIEPRDDYEVFLVVFLDGDGDEVDRREVRAPDVLELARDSITFTDVAGDASSFLVVPVTHRGVVGSVTTRVLSTLRDGERPAS